MSQLLSWLRGTYDDVMNKNGKNNKKLELTAAGFPVTSIEREGTHYDDPGDVVNGNPVPGTVADLQSLLLPFLSDGWTAP